MECRAIDWWDATEDPELKFRKGISNCENCGKPLGGWSPGKIFLSLQYRGGHVFITCSQCNRSDMYDIRLSRFLADPVEWIAHLYEKNWFEPEKFCKAMYRLRDAKQEIDQAERGRGRVWMKES